ncbi:DUF4199 domain-containing protein [Mucilaginibacter sp. HMF5004]|uniref:DUF4199 domain-containing protein n=1 Tax=Mucilaginibacter rivuli TaxID=2857527 RepID=UPI001C602280|nr:DUF4199 domain-containing protein [Mucilaginibacter rivuli]MBW4891454.1 DUF4199 domain-containing protein [Mucilaginibacter rivuli]
MEDQLIPLPPNPTKIATKWALISLAIGIVITYAVQFSGLDMNSPVKYLGYIPFIGGLLLTQKEFKDELGGYLTFGQGFSAGFRFALFNGLLLAIFTYLYLAILSPDVFAKAMETSRAAMVAKGMSDEQVEKAMAMAIKFGPIGGAFFLAIWYAILGAILALIGASIFKKEKTLYDIEREAAANEDTTPAE